MILKKEAEKSTQYWKEIVVAKPLVESISQRNEERRLQNLVQNLTISNPGMKALSSNASPGWEVFFFFFCVGISRCVFSAPRSAHAASTCGHGLAGSANTAWLSDQLRHPTCGGFHARNSPRALPISRRNGVVPIGNDAICP